jgi:predicted polyphosphate/ATP-dependent NAD kinase
VRDTPAEAARIGIIVNPIAGVGGPLALHGSDRELAAKALGLGAQPHAAGRMVSALVSLRREAKGPLEVVAGEGAMGEDAAREAGLTVVSVLPRATAGTRTSAADTRLAAESAAKHPVDLLLFAGGDGTATDVAVAVGDSTPVLGVPSGVKMHSGVFAIDPERAGRIAAAFLASTPPRSTRTADVLDVVGDDVARPIAHVVTPRSTGIQNPKAVSPGSDGAVVALGHDLADAMEPGRLYLIGPGMSAGTVLDALSLQGSVSGVDAVIDGRLVARDATERELLDLVSTHAGTRLVLGVVGGQGFLLGRGNQQISRRVLTHIEPDDVIIVAAHDKIAALTPPVLHVDLGADAGELSLQGYRTVRTSPTRSVVMRVGIDHRKRGLAS